MTVDNALNGCTFSCGIEISTKVRDLDDFSGDRFPQRRWLIDRMR